MRSWKQQSFWRAWRRQRTKACFRLWKQQTDFETPSQATVVSQSPLRSSLSMTSTITQWTPMTIVNMSTRWGIIDCTSGDNIVNVQPSPSGQVLALRVKSFLTGQSKTKGWRIYKRPFSSRVTLVPKNEPNSRRDWLLDPLQSTVDTIITWRRAKEVIDPNPNTNTKPES